MALKGTFPVLSQGVRFAVFAAVLAAGFAPMLMRWFRASLRSDLESYVFMVPFLSAYLFLRGRKAGAEPAAGADGPSRAVSPRRAIALLLWAGAGAMLALQRLKPAGAWFAGDAGAFFLPVLAFVTALLGGALFWFGGATLRRAWFPLLFLYAITPLPEPVVHGLEAALQEGSAGVAHALFRLAGTPVFREGRTFCLPGLAIEVSEACSGIHSTLVLFITSLVAGHLVLRKGWSRVLLTLLVIPVGLLRNGIRVVSLSWLTLHVDRGIIHGPLHRQGGPVYFGVSLLALLAALWGLRRWEQRKEAAP
jgi:exosortase